MDSCGICHDPLSTRGMVRLSLDYRGLIPSKQTQLICTSGSLKTPFALEFLEASHTDVQPVFAHSAAHVLGLALESEYGEDLLLSDGPPLNKGKLYGSATSCDVVLTPTVAGVTGEFFYEALLPGGSTIHESELVHLTSRARSIVKVHPVSLGPEVAYS